LYISNQFLDISIVTGVTTPDTGALATTNSEAGTLDTSSTCLSEHGSYPNFILTDFSTVPSDGLMKAVAQVSSNTENASHYTWQLTLASPYSLLSQMNGVDYTAPTSSSGSSSSGGGSSSSSSTTSSASSRSQSAVASITALALAVVSALILS
jgi:hypothetical protein